MRAQRTVRILYLNRRRPPAQGFVLRPHFGRPVTYFRVTKAVVREATDFRLMWDREWTLRVRLRVSRSSRSTVFNGRKGVLSDVRVN